MVRFHKIENTQKDKSTQTRASVYHPTPKNNSNNNNYSNTPKEITFLPNYLIENNQINFDSQMPEQDVIKNWTIKPETIFTTKMLNCALILEQKFNIVGKLLCIGLNKELKDLVIISEGSFSIVRFNDGIEKAVSALHIVNQNPMDEYEEFIFGSFEEKIPDDFSTHLLKKLRKITTSNQKKIIFLRNYLTSKNFYEFYITPGYLERRKNFLLKIKNTKDEIILLDPEYELQPQPSVDMVFLDLPEYLTLKIHNAELNPLKISNKDNHEVGYLVAYHCCDYTIGQNSAEYCKTEFPELIIMSRLINENKSLGQCEIKKYTKNIITYLASTGVGSSGGCILDEDGDIIAMNFGNYCDREEEGVSSEKLESYDFLSTVENKANLTLSKNINLAMNLKHDFIDYYFEKDLSENQNDKPSDEPIPTEEDKLLGEKRCREDGLTSPSIKN